MSKRSRIYESIPTFPSKRDRRNGIVHMVVETPKGSPYKFALDPERGLIALHDVLPAGYHWPFDYGFLPRTLGDDGDALDVLILLDTPTFPGCLLRARLLGAIRERKNGIENDRFVAAPEPMKGITQPTDGVATLGDLPPERRTAIETFLRGYSRAQGNDIEIVAAVERDEALELIATGRRRARDAA